MLQLLSLRALPRVMTRESVRYKERSHMMQKRLWVLQLKSDSQINKSVNILKDFVYPLVDPYIQKLRYCDYSNIVKYFTKLAFPSHLDIVLHLSHTNWISILIFSISWFAKRHGTVSLFIYLFIFFFYKSFSVLLVLIWFEFLV